MSKETELINAFLELGQDVNDNTELVSKCLEICDQFTLNPRQLVFKWEAHMDKLATEGAPKLEHFEILRAEIARKSTNKQDKNASSNGTHRAVKEGVKFDINSIQQLGQMLTTNSTSSKILGNVKVKLDPNRLSTSVTSTVPLKRKALDIIPPTGPKLRVLPTSESENHQASISELEANRYANREHKFRRLNVLNEALPSVKRNDTKIRCDLEIIRDVPSFRFMYERIENKCMNLLDRLKTITDGIIEVNKLKEKADADGQSFSLSPVNMASQDRVWCCGRICAESDFGPLNAFSILLEGANGRRVKLDTSALSDFALFPGQIVVVEGNNTTGNTIVANSIFCNASLPLPLTEESKLATFNESSGKNSSILSCFPRFGYTLHSLERRQSIWAGRPSPSSLLRDPSQPGATCTRPVRPRDRRVNSMDLAFKPLDDLLEYAREHRPDVLLLCGPFADHAHQLLDPTSSAPQGFNPPDSLSLVQRILRDHIAIPLKPLGIKCLLVPSVSDLHSTCVFPQPALDADIVFGASDPSDPLPLLLSNPCTFRVNEVVISVATTDIMLHLSGSEASRISGDRLSRLAAHVVEQRSFYPLFPPAEGSQISMANSSGLELPLTPDILVLPSQLNPFAKRSGEVLCVNPGRLTKGTSAGTFAHVTVHPIIRHLDQRKDGQDVKMGQEQYSEFTAESSSSPEKLSSSVLDVNPAKSSDALELDGSHAQDKHGETKKHGETELNESRDPAHHISASACRDPLPATAPKSLGPRVDNAEASIEDNSFMDVGERQKGEAGNIGIAHRILARTRAEIIRI